MRALFVSNPIGPKEFRLVLPGLAGTLCALLVWTDGNHRAAPPSSPAQASQTRDAQDFTLPLDGETRLAIERALAQASAYAPVFERMREEFPGDYERQMNEFIRQARRNGVQSADFYSVETIRSLRHRRGLVAARAGSAKLMQVFDIQGQMLDALAKVSPALCVNFLYGDTGATFYGFAAENRQLIAGMALAAIEAAADGAKHSFERATPSARDFDLLDKALIARGLSRDEVNALLDGEMPTTPPSDARLCEAGRLYIEAMRKLPEGPRLRIQALAISIMARS